jgi:hypothetical protein
MQRASRLPHDRNYYFDHFDHLQDSRRWGIDKTVKP